MEIYIEEVETTNGIGIVEFSISPAEKGDWYYPGCKEQVFVENTKWHRYDEDGERLPEVSIENLSEKEIKEIEKVLYGLIHQARIKYGED